MALNGVRQLKTVTLRYCKFGGSSTGMRQFLESDLKSQFEATNLHLTVQELHKGNKHPIIIAEYVNGYKTQIDVRNKSPTEILHFVNFLNSKRPGPTRSFQERYKVVSQRPSIQGVWHPDDWLPVHTYRPLSE